MNNLSIILCRCPGNKKLFGIRAQQTPEGDWLRTWAFPISESDAKAEGYDRSRIQGSLSHTAEYPGCPYCGNTGFVICVNCKKMSCYNQEEIDCPWCGTHMSSFTIAERFDVMAGED